MYFVSEIYIKTLKKNIKVKSITTSQQKEICKILLNNNNSSYTEILNCLIEENITEEININQLTLAEKLLILLKLRGVSIGNIANLSSKKDNKTYNIEYNFNDILFKLNEAVNKNEPLTITTNSISVFCDIPKIYTEKDILQIQTINSINYIDIIPFYVYQINIKDQVIIFEHLTSVEQLEIVKKLPVNVIDKIKTYITNSIENFQQVTIYKDLESEIKLNFINSSYWEYLKFLFREDLLNIYQSIYILNKHIGMSSDYIEALTPVERDLYINLLKQEKEPAEQKASEKNVPIRDPLSELDAFMMDKGG